MEKKVNKKITNKSDKTKEKNKILKKENLKLKAMVFHLLKIHRVQPEGVRLGKTMDEINDMTILTINHVLKSDCSVIIEDYSHASLRKITKKINKLGE